MRISHFLLFKFTLWGFFQNWSQWNYLFSEQSLFWPFLQQQILTVQNLQNFHNLTNYYRTWLIKTLAPVWFFLNVHSTLTFTSFDLEDNQTQKCNPMTEVSNCSWKRTNLRDSIRKKNMKRWEEEKQFGNKVLYVCHGVNLILFK